MAKTAATLLGAYLIVGNDELKSKTATDRLWARLSEQGNTDFDGQILEGSKITDLVELLDSLNTPPLASPFRLVIIKEVDKGGKQLVDALVDYLESHFESTVLVMTATKLTQQSRLYKAVKNISAKAIIDAADLKKSELPAMVRQLAQGYQISISYEGSARLAELVGGSTTALNTEVKKLASYIMALGRSEASLDDVNAVVARTSQPSGWDFVDAFSQRELVASLEILKLLTRESPVSLLYLLVTRLREILQYQSLCQRGEGGVAKAMGKPDWQLKRLDVASQRFSAAELRAILAQAANADARMKSGEDAQRVLEELVLANCR